MGGSELQQDRSAAPNRAFEVFLAEVRPRLRGLFSRYQVPLAETEDILQQSLLALVIKGEGIRNREAWLIGTVRKHCLLYWRQRRRALYQAVDQTMLEVLAPPVSPEQSKRDARHDLERLLADLPEQCRRVFVLRYQLGKEPAEIAALLGYKHASMGKITARCMARLLRRALQLGMRPLG